MPHQPNTYAGLTVPLTTLALVNDIAIIKIPAAATIVAVSGSLRLLTSGTQTVLLKNDAGTTLATLTWVAAGEVDGTVNSAAISAADSIHVNVSGLAVGAQDCTITIWLKFASLA